VYRAREVIISLTASLEKKNREKNHAQGNYVAMLIAMNRYAELFINLS